MTTRELYARLNERIPRELSCEWDNDGLMCCPDGSREVRRVLVALDATGAVVDKAVFEGFDLILTHHPFIFKGIRAIEDESAVAAKAIELIKAGISVMSFHTRLDAVEGGVNDMLASLLELKNVEVFYGEGLPMGRVGDLDCEITLLDFARKVKAALDAPFVSVTDSNREVKRVAVLGGSGKDFLGAAAAMGADTYVSGELGHHTMTDEPDVVVSPLNLIEAGHFYTEFPVCKALCDMVAEIDGSIYCEIINSNPIKAV
jgi:dinuclear metal center YbgI/SA1388 family protein